MTASHLALDPALTRGAAQRALIEAFTAAKLETPALDARLLLCAGLGIDHLALVCDPDSRLGGAASLIAAMAERRLQREPVSRILGRREFYGLGFAISPAVLDPRSDTEVLVEAVLAHFAERREAPLRLLDFGVGSGAILGALLSQLPNAFGIGVDCSEAACQLARINLANLGLSGRSAVFRGDWDAAISGGFDVVVANPPYIASAEVATLAREVREHDPAAALDGGIDGLAAYRSLARPVARLLASHGFTAFEVGADQAAPVAALLRDAGLQDVGTKNDLAGHARVITAIGAIGPRREPEAHRPNSLHIGHI